MQYAWRCYRARLKLAQLKTEEAFRRAHSTTLAMAGTVLRGRMSTAKDERRVVMVLGLIGVRDRWLRKVATKAKEARVKAKEVMGPMGRGKGKKRKRKRKKKGEKKGAKEGGEDAADDAADDGGDDDDDDEEEEEEENKDHLALFEFFDWLHYLTTVIISDEPFDPFKDMCEKAQVALDAANRAGNEDEIAAAEGKLAAAEKMQVRVYIREDAGESLYTRVLFSVPEKMQVRVYILEYYSVYPRRCR